MSASKNDPKIDQTGLGISGGTYRDVDSTAILAQRDVYAPRSRPKATADATQTQEFTAIIINTPSNDQAGSQSTPEPRHRSSNGGPQSYHPSLSAWLTSERYGAGPAAWSPEEALFYLPQALEDLDISRKKYQSQVNLLDEVVKKHEEACATHSKQLKAVYTLLADAEEAKFHEIGMKTALIRDLEEKVAYYEQLVVPHYEQLKIEYSKLRCQLMEAQGGVGGASNLSLRTDNEDRNQMRSTQIRNELDGLERELGNLEKQDLANKEQLSFIEIEMEQAVNTIANEEEREAKLTRLQENEAAILKGQTTIKVEKMTKKKAITKLNQEWDDLVDQTNTSNVDSHRRESASSGPSNQGLTDGSSVAESDISSQPTTAFLSPPSTHSRPVPAKPSKAVKADLTKIHQDSHG